MESDSTEKEQGGVREWEEASFTNLAAAKGRMKERRQRNGEPSIRYLGFTWSSCGAGHRAVQALDVGRTVTLDPRWPLAKRTEQIMLVVQRVLRETVL